MNKKKELSLFSLFPNSFCFIYLSIKRIHQLKKYPFPPSRAPLNIMALNYLFIYLFVAEKNIQIFNALAIYFFIFIINLISAFLYGIK